MLPGVLRSTIKEPTPRYFRLGIELDHVTALAFSDNSKRLVCATAKSRVRGGVAFGMEATVDLTVRRGFTPCFRKY